MTFLIKKSKPYYYLSSNLEKTEYIATTGKETLLIKGDSIDSNIYKHINQGEEIISIWPQSSMVVTDSVNMGINWESVTTTDKHTYVIVRYQYKDFLDGLCNLCLKNCITPVLLYDNHLIIGPIFYPNYSPCIHCWVERLMANIPSLRERAKRAHTPCVVNYSVENILSIIKIFWEVRKPNIIPQRALTINLQQGTMEYQLLLTSHNCECIQNNKHLELNEPILLEDLLGNIFGKIHSIGTPISSDKLMFIKTTYSRGKLPFIEGCGCSLDEKIATSRAMAESLERTISSMIPDHCIYEDFNHISLPIAIEKLSPYTEIQIKKQQVPFVTFNVNEKLYWCYGYNLCTGRKVNIPMCLVINLPDPYIQAFAPHTATGVASAPSWPVAVRKAFFEVIERDIVCRAWSEGNVKRIDPTYWAPKEARQFMNNDYNMRLAICLNEWDVPVVVAMIKINKEISYGCAAFENVSGAAIHAIEEAYQMLIYQRNRTYFNLEDPIWQVMEWADINQIDRGFSYEKLLTHYQPIVVDLTNYIARSVCIKVASVWSSMAVDFSTIHFGIPLVVWQPSVYSRERIKFLSHFVSKKND